MKLIDSSDKKVKKICDVLVRETLEPAKKQAEEIIEEANLAAKKCIELAQQKGRQIIEKARLDVEEKQRVFDSSLKVSSQKALTALRDQIEKQLFSDELDAQVSKYLSEKDVVAKLIDALISTLNKEGLKTDLDVIISNKFKPEEISAALLEASRLSLSDKGVSVASMDGVIIKSVEKSFSIDVTDEAIKLLMSRYAQESLRKILFNL
ncbi:MAG: hypothetical protein P0S95_04510 [Rhabdochlamydiaceae bacterium]|nr:hypothetical protein [Candidatus Amphrikana amoebophyrae]